MVHLALAPKSNAVIMAMGAAMADVRAGLAGPVPPHLRDAHYPGAKKLGHGKGYATRTTTRAASSRSSTRPTRCSAGTTTGRPGTGPRRGWPSGSRGCARSSPAALSAPAGRRPDAGTTQR